MNRTCKSLIQALLACTALTQPAPVTAGEMPTGGTTAYGSVGIAMPSANQMTIQQSTQTAIVNWQGFSVGAGNRVDIVQPSASSAILNRVTGSAPSTIAGQINANGQVYLVNPNGITITPTGVVNTGAFVASTLDISDHDFAAGRRIFRGNGQSAPVSNQGTIAIRQGGYAALLGGQVDNSGLITVPMGRVGLGAGEQATLDLTGDGFLQVAVPSKSDGSDTPLLRHSGRIKAVGGQVVMQAATAREMARNAINLSGLVEAHSISGRSGAIVLGGGDGGKVAVTGRLDVSARAGTSRQSTRQPARGGNITVAGNDIQLKGAALLANGQVGGGSINVGGGFRGEGPLQRASTTTVDAATTISADAGRAGTGGNVVIWSDHFTGFAGRISATGGGEGGDGGQAEVSGKSVLAYAGTTDLSGVQGRFGTLLLDPYNVTISSGADSSQPGFAATSNNSIISAQTLEAALRTASVTVTTGGAGSPGSQAGDITVAAPVTWGTGASEADTTLTLNAYRSISVDANLTVNGNGRLVLNTNLGGTGGVLSFGSGASASFINLPTAFLSDRLTINGAGYTLVRQQDFTSGFPARLLQTSAAKEKFALAENIDGRGATLTAPVNALLGTDVPFSGELNGLGHGISNLNIRGAGRNTGLFSTSNGAIFANLNLSNLNVTGVYTGSASSNVGGLVGEAINTIIAGVSVSGTVTNRPTSPLSPLATTGGLAGSSSGVVERSFSTATVSGGGGGSSATGGLVGLNSGSVTQSYATGDVTGGFGNGDTSSGINGSVTGGLIGANRGAILQTYATGAVVSGSGPAANLSGGLIGSNTGTVTASFWDQTSTGQSEAAGNTTALTGATGLQTSQFQDPAAFVPLASGQGWDFRTVWAPPRTGVYPLLYTFTGNAPGDESPTQPVTGGQTPAERASELAGPAITPNVPTILPNFTTAALPLGDTLDLGGGGGPTLGVSQGSVGGGSQTRAGALSALASIQAASNALEGRLAACDKTTGNEPGSLKNCYSGALDGFADTMDIQVQQLPPAFRGLPAIIRQAAREVRVARTVTEARAAVRVAVVAVRKAIALLRADEPAVARIQARQGNAIASALRMVDNRLARATGL